jgi:hypothetical protein
MPSRSENHEDDNHQEIKIPTPKRFSTGNISPETEGINTSTKNAPQSASGFKKTAVTTNIGIIKPKGSAVMPEKNAVGSVAMNRADKKLGSTESSSVQDSSVLQKPDFIDDKLGAHSTHQAKELSKKIKQDKNEDQSIFKGESEVSRIKLRHEMKLDPKVWQASRQVGLNLSPVERAKLVKEVFSPVLGSNISKTDLKLSIKKLNQKMLGTQDSAEHAKIRKEIKFFKKIGGIK